MTRYVDTADIAEDLELGRKYVTDRVVKRADFPKPVINLTQKTRKWARAEFNRWKSSHWRAA
jgi:predicted DNA-binding transcriptional regulator AlpA